MLERYYIRPETVDRVRSSWIGEAISKYVVWLTEQGYASRTVYRRLPIVMHFGEFARNRGAQNWDELPSHVQAFVASWVAERCRTNPTQMVRKELPQELENPIRQMLRLVVSSIPGSRRRQRPQPLQDQAPQFFEYLRQERGLRPASVRNYRDGLYKFAAYLAKIRLDDLRHLSPPILAGFVTDLGTQVSIASLRTVCGVLRVFLRYLARERILPKDLSPTVEMPQTYRLAKIPRSITWDEVRRMLETINRRTSKGKRDYAMLLLLVTYGLRAHEAAALTLDCLDWRSERLRIPERKAGHSTAYPLSPLVGQAIVEYLKNGRPPTADRRIFLRVLAPYLPLTSNAIAGLASHYLHKAGISVPLSGSHTLRHTCVQRLVDEGFSLKVIGDYVGHQIPASTEIYSKVDVEGLREVAQGVGEEIL